MSNKELNNVVAYPLFNGHINYGLSAAEWRTLEQKIKVQGKHITRKQVMESLYEMSKYPTGAVMLRKIIASNQNPFIVESSKEGDAKCDLLDFTGFNDGEKTVVHSKQVSKDMGPILLHEMLHQMNAGQLPHNSLIADMPTQALDEQLKVEMDGKNKAYYESYQINLRKWREIVEGRLPKPDWAPTFEPINLSGDESEHISLAKEFYIQQYAALDTQQQYMMDFFMSRRAMSNGDFEMPVPSYIGLRSHIFYDSDTIRRDRMDFDITPDVERFLQQSYPGLDMVKIKRHAAELEAEHTELKSAHSYLMKQLYNRDYIESSLDEQVNAASACISQMNCSKEAKTMLAESLLDSYMDKVTSDNGLQSGRPLYPSTTLIHTDGYAEIKSKSFQRELEAATKNAPNPERAEFDFVLNHPKLSTSAKLFKLSEIIGLHKNRYPDKDSPEGLERRSMILQMREKLGMDGLPVASVDSNLQDSLRSSSDGTVLPIDQDVCDSALTTGNIGGSRMV